MSEKGASEFPYSFYSFIDSFPPFPTDGSLPLTANLEKNRTHVLFAGFFITFATQKHATTTTENKIMTNNKKIIPLEGWKRREYFEFFGRMDDPFFGLTAHADFTRVYHEAKDSQASFFLYSLHHILTVVNAIEELRMRTEGDSIVLYDHIGASPTIGREDGSFGFGCFDYYADRTLFVEEATREIANIKGRKGLCPDADHGRQDIIYYSSLPWIDFTGLKHACNCTKGTSVPRISTGRLTEHDGRHTMAVSIEVNHGFADGRHVAEFFRLLNL